MGSRVVISFPGDNTKTIVNVANIEAVKEIDIPAGSVVELHGIVTDETLNGEVGVVVDASSGVIPGRLQLQLLNKKCRMLSIKPENVRILKDEA